MKVFVITLALAGLASTATLDAQIMGSRPVPTSNGSINVDGSWRVIGRDGNGNTIYERRTQDRNGNILVQRATRDRNGNMSIISTNTLGNTSNRGILNDGSWRVVGRDGNGNTIYERRTTDRNGNILVQRAVRDRNGNMSIISSNTVGNTSNRGSNNCDYTRSTNTVGDIIFGRTNSNVNCDDNGNRIDGGWYQVGRGRDNNSIYERRIRDANGNLVIQRARRNPNGSFTIFNSRYANDNDKQWRKAQQKQQKELRKEQKQQDRQGRKSERGDDNDNRSVVTRGDDRSYVASNAAAKGNGHGKDNGKGKHKDKD